MGLKERAGMKNVNEIAYINMSVALILLLQLTGKIKIDLLFLFYLKRGSRSISASHIF